LSRADLEKWDSRYRDGAYASRTHATRLVERFASGLAAGRALDVAAGTGRNALFLARLGFEVDAVDISGVGLSRMAAEASARQLEVRAFEADLEHGIPETPGIGACYDLIVMTRYVNLPLVDSLIDRLADGGIFISEQHLKTGHDVVGPKSPEFRLAPNALLDAARRLRIHYYREGLVTDPDGRRAALAQVVGSNGEADLLVG